MRKSNCLPAALALIIALVFISGCGCSGGTSSAASTEKAKALLMEAGKAVSETSSYRMNGTMRMDADQAGEGEPLDWSLDIQGEIQQSAGIVSEHMVMSVGASKQESYTIGSDYYAFVTDKGWAHMSTGNSKIQNSSLGMIDIQQLGLMAELGQDIKVFEESTQRIGISFRLAEDFFKSSLQSEEGVSQEWLDAAGEYLSGLAAEVRLWILSDSMLVDAVELRSNLSEIPPYGMISMSIDLEVRDYNQGLRITLPEEAKNAVEVTLPS
ncbi:MAG: hypothetical protein A2V52_01015 [Actinobacteria bacterium RBG_19FT_COMBO_54_7]|uniref:LppX_LprAFG lipoprotein n=1 Tax=Candidatus Solincola sediminis TaxID=1797199 RepID=A0A1F2WNT1_9ACTN|nr:MAG: hypothetical protein A2Y75_02905 [Candidatus Solincola sediminis]OFW65376.1 MAG: hypothetical protein A2V52_01015 [Actinobacteria bacterium RBG_19FT_COMBO_54_7]